MKILSLLVLVLAFAGCTPDKPRTTALTAPQATNLALGLANEKAQALYQCRPYTKGPAAQLSEGHWVWHDRCYLTATALSAYWGPVSYARDTRTI